MEEGDVIEAEGGGERRIAFMARAADRVEALPTRLQAPRDAVELAAEALAVENLGEPLRRQPNLLRRGRARARRQAAVTQPRDEFLMHGFGGVHAARLRPSGANSQARIGARAAAL
jgi:hypothetical protein